MQRHLLPVQQGLLPVSLHSAKGQQQQPEEGPEAHAISTLLLRSQQKQVAAHPLPLQNPAGAALLALGPAVSLHFLQPGLLSYFGGCL